MEKLKELVNIVTPNRIKQISILGGSLGKTTKLMQLYYGVYNKKFLSDQDAIDSIYGNEKIGSKYSKLKGELEMRLLNSLLISDLCTPKMNERQKAYFKYFKVWAAANLLSRLGKHSLALKLLEKSYKFFQKYEFTFLALETAKTLRNYYYKYFGDIKKGDYFNQQSNKLFEQYQAEFKVSEFIEIISAKHIREAGNKGVLTKTIDTFLAEAKTIIPSEITGTIYYKYNFLRLIRNLNVHEYEKVADICEKAIQYFEKNAVQYRTFIIIFFNHWIISCIQLKKFYKASDLLKRTLEYTKDGEFNWFKLKEYETQLSFFKKDYSQAYSSYLQVKTHKNINSLTLPLIEEWKLYEAYAQFVYLAGKVDGAKTAAKKFKVQKFLNDIHIFSQDKKGMNIPILFIHIAYLILYRRYHQIIDKAEGLEKYRQRYLCNPKHERSNLFLKLLLLLVKHHFDPQLVQADAQVLISELSAIPLNVFTTDHEVEIIPYEHFWELLLEIISANDAR